MTLLSGARWKAGFAHHNFTFAYNVKIGRAQSILGVRGVVHTAEHLASAFFALGVPISDVPRAQLSVSEQETNALPVQGRYAVLHPFAATPDKRWPAEKFCELARFLSLWKMEPVILAGAEDDVSAFGSHRIFRGTLSEAKALVSKASLFVGNDSGPAHMAAGFGVRTVVLFGPSKPAIWGPWRTDEDCRRAGRAGRRARFSRGVGSGAVAQPGRGARLSELLRLLRYARRYMPALLTSVVLMAIVGATQGLLLKLIPYIFDRVLKPDSPDTLVELFPIPFTDYAVYLNDFVPQSVHNVWTMIAIGILACFFAKGLCDYLGNYLMTWSDSAP